MPRVATIRFRQGTTSQWAAADAASGADPTRLLAAGEPGRDSTTGAFKIGNGTDTWANLPVASGAVASVNGRAGAVTGLAEDNAVLHLAGAETKTGILTLVDHTRFKSLPWSDPKADGAIGDSTNRTLSSQGYATLGAAQAAFPTLGGVAGIGGSAMIPILSTGDELDWAAIQTAVDRQTGSADPLNTTSGERVPAGPVRIMGMLQPKLNRPIVVRSVTRFLFEGSGRALIRPTTNMAALLDIDGVTQSTFRNLAFQGATGAMVDSMVRIHWSLAGEVDPSRPTLRPKLSTSAVTLDHIQIRDGDWRVGFGAAMDGPGDPGQVDNIDLIKLNVAGINETDPDIVLTNVGTTSGVAAVTGTGFTTAHKGRLASGTGITSDSLIIDVVAGVSATLSKPATATGTISLTLAGRWRAAAQIGNGTYGNAKAYNLWQPTLNRTKSGIWARGVQCNVFGGQMGSNGVDYDFDPPVSPNIIMGIRCEESNKLLKVVGSSALQTLTFEEMLITNPNLQGGDNKLIDWTSAGILHLRGIYLNKFTSEDHGAIVAGTLPQIKFMSPSSSLPSVLIASGVAIPNTLRNTYVTSTGTTVLTLGQIESNAGKQPIRCDPLALFIDGTMRFHLDPNGNVNVGDMETTLGGGVGVLALRNATTAPATTPTNGAVLYAESGTLKAKATDGVVTDLIHRRDLYTFATPGTTASWTVPSGIKSLRMRVQQPGAGGAGGSKAATGVASPGGGAGGSGSYSEVEYLVADLPAALKVEVGAGGAGGLGATADTTAGVNGTAGGGTYVAPVGGSLLTAYVGGTPSGAGSGTTGGSAGTGLEPGAAGGGASATGAAGTAGLHSYAGGGGGGGGVTSANAATAGGAGGYSTPRRGNTLPAGGAVGASGTAATAFGAGVSSHGGGGGGGALTGSAGDGGAGVSGSGGGGGGGARNGDRTVADAVTDGTATVTSDTIAAVALDVGSPVSGTNIPASTFVGIVNSATSIGLSSSATANVPVIATGSGSGGTLTITNTGGTGGKGGDGYVKIEVFF